MTDDSSDIPEPPVPSTVLTATAVSQGPYIPPQQQLVLYSDEQWEQFIQEWVHGSLKGHYTKVRRFSGANDRGIDIAGFADAQGLQGVWDNYQCKHYDHALYPGDVWVEIGKVLWHSFSGAYKAPRKYFFVAPRGAGTTATALFADAEALKNGVIENWEKHCRNGITTTQEITLDDGKFRAYVESFDYSIFDAKESIEIVEDHKKTSYHAARFGGGLPSRPLPSDPPAEIASTESRYVEKLLGAYADHTKNPVPDTETLKTWPKLKEHFLRQRVAFYHAESLRVFARDTVPPGTFKSFQDEIYTGVIDTRDASHADQYQRVCAVTKAARDLQITSNPLIGVSKPQDRDGVCHQLANEDRLDWTESS